ncbi:MAG TPA: A/G-specific adenine glycosylase [Rectinemataceae bacterium]|nr:A/G-specific adenine glycosylase [Rectinemataceae bacterium]
MRGKAERGPQETVPRIDEARLAEFRDLVMEHYRRAGRSFPWRDTRDPWSILVSEVMLQQTQTIRVVPKYEEWTRRWKGPAELAAAPLAEVLGLWSGLGYNRRALALVRAAGAVVRDHGGILPQDEASLLELPGVGSYTARAVLAFAFDRPVVFVETNIRAAFIHHFFGAMERVPDSLILPLVEGSLDRDDPRIWYYALMDYGAELKRTAGNASRRSAHYAKQSPFQDSHRRVRGAVLKALASGGEIGREELAASLPFARERVERAAAELVAEGFAEYRGEALRIRR